jgi:hypothetical protein
MRRFIALSLLLGAGTLPAQGFFDSSIRTGPQFYSYTIHGAEKVSELAFPVFVLVPVTSAFSVDIGTSYASADLDRTNSDQTHTKSSVSGLTDTQLRGNYSFKGDLFVLTAGLNLPTGSATIDPAELDASTRIGSDFLSFPISGFGSGFSMTGGAAVAHSLGSWNLGIGGSVRQGTEYTPFRDAADSAVKFTPGPEYRVRAGIDHPHGTGRISLGFMYSKFGDDKANAATYNTGNRFLGQLAVSNSMASHVDYSFVAWNLYRSSGTLIDGSASPSSNMTNVLAGLSIGSGSFSVQPSLEGRVVVGPELIKTNGLATAGLRFVINRGSWTIVPGGGYTVGRMDQGSLTGMRGTLAVRFGG